MSVVEAPTATVTLDTPVAPVGPERHPVRTAVMYVLITVIALGVLVPFVWMVSSSLKNNNEVFTVPTQWIPRDFQWHNYVDIWSRIPMTTYLRNSLFLSLVITFLQVLTGSFAAYGFSKVRWRGRDALFVAYIATIAVPWQAYMVPQYVMLQKAGLVNTFWSLILLQAFGAFGVFLLRQYYLTIPDELCEAARIDGLSEYGIYRRIILPLSKPALASLALLTFVATWNDYMGPFIYLTSNELWTVQLGLKSFVGLFDGDYAMIMTGSVISVVPILVIFLLGQKYFIQGIATSGLKG
jgi:multiple sugar transport system permease protein